MYSRHMHSTFEWLQDHTILYVMLFKRSIFQFAHVGIVFSPIEDSKRTDVR